MRHLPVTFSSLLLALPAFADAILPQDVAAITVTQASVLDGNRVPPPLVGVAAPEGATLPFHVTMDFSCPAGTERGKLFVSIADTTRIEDPVIGTSRQTLRLDVPLRQLQWLAEPARYCVNVTEQREPDEVDGSGVRFFRLHAGAAAYATVTCLARQDVLSSATSSAPLDVWLSCPLAAPEAR